MSSGSVQDLCLELIAAESEARVIELLQAAGYWEDQRFWRYYGDSESNWAQAGGQQARADFALNEKAVNAIDSILTRLCLEAGIDPESDQAPKSVREAVARFIEETGNANLKTTGGRVEDWPAQFATKVAQNISIFTTEPQGAVKDTLPCINIADRGEGQTPDNFPNSFTSLNRSNKVKVHFVQGKFGQGGSGVARHGGQHRLQLIVSRRDPRLLGGDAGDDDHKWGFTIVRREGGDRSPYLSYLAPLDSDQAPRKGRVLRFSADAMPIFPEGDVPYRQAAAFGTLVKLYDYRLKGLANNNMLRRGGLLAKMDLLLPDPALPIRLHECRKRLGYGSEREQSTTMSGLFSRLAKSDNVEEGFPASIPITVKGYHLTARVYAFKPDRSKTYRDNEGVIFTVNGQAHGYTLATIFARKRVGLQRLAKDLLVIIDCSTLSALDLSDLFMSSRDRLADESPMAVELERSLERALADHEGLRELNNRRRQEDIAEQLGDQKPLEQIIRQVLKTSPSLMRLFGKGERLNNPFKPEEVKPSKQPPQLRPHPTYFRIAGIEEGEIKSRTASLGQRCRMRFVTDAEDDYFTRKYDPGTHRLARLMGDVQVPVEEYIGPTCHFGRAPVTFDLPGGAKVGDRLRYEFVVHDPVTDATFRNEFELLVTPEVEQSSGGHSSPRPPSEQDGKGVNGPSGIELPAVVWVNHGPKWSEHFSSDHDCLDVIDDGQGKQREFTFYLNAENRPLQFELKGTKESPEIVRKQFEVAAVLVGLALIHEDLVQSEKPGQKVEADAESQLRERVKSITRALSPVLIPMIRGLDLDAPDSIQSDEVGLAA